MDFLASHLPLSSDPNPPTHQAGSSFEGFFIRLQSHNGAASPPQPPSSPPPAASSSSPASLASPSTDRPDSSPFPPSPRSQPQPQTALPSSSRHAATQAHRPDPNAANVSPPHETPGDLILVICELQSAPPEEKICLYMRWIAHGEESSQAAIQRRRNRNASSSFLDRIGTGLDTTSDSIPFSAIDIPATSSRTRSGPKSNHAPPAHGETGETGPPASKRDQSFETVQYIPRWRLRLGPSVDPSSPQAFRIQLPCSDVVGALLGSLEVTDNGNLRVDLTLPRSDGEQGATRVQLCTQRRVPWNPASAQPRWYDRLPLSSKGPEGLLQHLGLLLPLHWYVHATQSPATYTIQHIDCSSPAGSPASQIVSSGSASVHFEKNWGHGFPTGWLWCQAASEIVPQSRPGASNDDLTAHRERDSDPPRPLDEGKPPEDIRVSLAGGSILSLTAFLVGIRIGTRIAWDFRPPFAVGPGFAVEDAPRSYVNYGIGFKIRRDFPSKAVRIEVWNLTRWARLEISGDPATFATKIPGPRPGGWTPGYCHHSYRCRMQITLFERPLTSIPSTFIASALANPMRSWSDLKALLRWPSTASPNKLIRPSNMNGTAVGGRLRRRARRTASMDPDPRLGDLEEESEEDEETLLAHARRKIDDAWCRTFGWHRIGQWSLEDRVALEFGGDFAR
ncbi:uncharacterized protein PFL1_04149 [Pseudozyma flocculosa PF-1]|uniref:Uncharacterized protein n=2 Tax=Pseudozyma flocculosa TaxID=84751 RepID=A0A5C3ETS2_9BASI|nr:uncharacterized protein PFL1_04149 [Pseudozyma flocculosa PF-1]EPQ28322.1 hypothetical protein PFL1_04149 [Pseudozyma flocculosa PF-1]SPO35472.1 uncharacterized protein PSFLO_00943 [Pseudozyma flocculosa]